MFIDNGGPAYMSLGYTKNVWIAGTCEISYDQDEIADFFVSPPPS